LNIDNGCMLQKLAACFLLLAPSMPAQPIALGAIKKIYVDKMPNGLDQFIRTEIGKQFKGRVTVVEDQKDADAILAGVFEEETGKGAKITGRYLGLHDVATGTVNVLDKDGKILLWSEEAGDRSVTGAFKGGGERKVAERLVKKLEKVMR